MGQAYFQFKKFRVEQGHSPMRVNTDSCLLGAIAKPGSQDRMLDIGAGTGVLSLMMAQKAPMAKIIALEPNQKALLDLELNLKQTGWEQSFEIVPKSLQDYVPKQGFDFIISNPPYFAKALPNPDKDRATAKHQIGLGAKDFVKFARVYLAPAGRTWVILPVMEARLMQEEMEKQGLFLRKEIQVSSFPYSKVIRKIQVFFREEGKSREVKLFLYQSHGHYSKEVKRLFSPYYL